jgi:hypothetical protein
VIELLFEDFSLPFGGVCAQLLTFYLEQYHLRVPRRLIDKANGNARRGERFN